MNCRQFDKIVFELARAEVPPARRGPLMDAAAHTDGHAHVETCERCAVRLADERALNAGLRAVAADDASKAAPQAVEVALLVAFRQHVAAPVASTSFDSSSATRVVVQRPRSYWRRWGVAAAAAAALIVLAALGLSQLSGPTRPAQQPELGKTKQKPSTTSERELVTAPSTNDVVERWTAEDRAEQPQHIAYKPGAMRSIKHPMRVKSPWDEARLVVNLGTVQAASPPEEVATDFIPINLEGAQAPLDSGQIVRVKMPRAALATFGLPVNVERSQEPIKADVLYGSDGLARAVRFIRD